MTMPARRTLIRLAESVLCGHMERRKPGRPSKGDRCQVNTRQPAALAAAAAAAADARGMTLTDYIGHLLAKDLGMTYTNQEALQLSA